MTAAAWKPFNGMAEYAGDGTVDFDSGAFACALDNTPGGVTASNGDEFKITLAASGIYQHKPPA